MFLRSLRHSPRLIGRFQTRWASPENIGEGITECEVISWSVSPSATVGSFDPLCEVQSDKASVEITSPFDGVVKELLVQEGEVAKVGQGLCTIEVDEEKNPRSRLHPPPAPEPSPSPRKLHPMDPAFVPEKGADSWDVLATPSVRHYARTQGVDLALLAPGSGKGGRVEKSDVEAYLSRSSSAPSSPAPAQPSGEDIIVELGRTRQAMFRAMVKSLEIPLFGYSTTLDITDLHSLLPILNTHIPSRYVPASASNTPARYDPASALGAGLPAHPDVPDTGRYTRLTYLPFLLKTLALTMMDWPLFRSAINHAPPSSASASTANANAAKPSLTIRPHADIALALNTPTGLYTPLLRAADTRSVYTLASDIAHLAALGRRTPSGLTSVHLGAGTLSVSNVGAAGKGTGAAPVLVPGGGVAIVALGRAEWVWDVSERYWQRGEGEWKGVGGGERRLKLPVSWSADHRVVEGAEMAAFVEAWRGWVEAPTRLVGEGV
ncbi:dihydrolipoamide acetyltransferase component of pyruvate dehydrogenase complex [Favolaschia claudopus]|uniref:Dihydrolipoamide acetyltransferase component of pyruvate dehydrogenase complex n=1 Tax=Favolaschia claudopus TaxID=2862362 RepID=A0AAW0BEX2_9AGAR